MPRWRWAPGAAVVAEVSRLPALSRSSFTTTSSFSSSLLALCCLGPPPPSHRAPLPSTTSVSRGVHVSGGRSGRRHTERGGGFSLASFRPAGKGGSPEGGGSLSRSVRRCGCVLAGQEAARRGATRRGEATTCRFCGAAAKDADDAAAAAVRETEPSMGPQPLECAHFSCGGSAQSSFENGGLRLASEGALTPASGTHRK